MNGKGRRKRLRIILVVMLLLAGLSGTLLALSAYQRYSALYRQDMAVAQSAEQRLHSAASMLEALAQNPFDTAALSQARQNFTAADQEFTQLEQSLQTLPAISDLLPIYGPRVSAAQHLAALASDIAQGGALGCTLLQTLLQPVASGGSPAMVGPAITATTLAQVDHDARLITASLNAAIGEARQVAPADVQFDAHLASLLATFQENIPLIQSWLHDINASLAVAPSVLGIGLPTNYLIEVLDSTELRPGGGFIGNYGIATIANGQLTGAHITDVDLLDRPFEFAKHTIPYPPQFTWFSRFIAPGGWSLRDSNLSADFPTSARYGEANYHLEGGNVPVQGVIAITPAFIEGILNITGPVAVPEYQEVVTAQNLIEKIHYYQLGAGRAREGQALDYVPAPSGHSSERKQFVELLAEHLFARVHQLSTATGKGAINRPLLQLLITSLRTKDVQVYFNQSAAEKLLQDAHLDAAIDAPVASDSLFVVNANLSSNKANPYISITINDAVTIDAQGDALHQTTLRYAWTTPGDVYGNSLYTDYIHVYVPPGSTLYAADGWTPQGTNGRDQSGPYGREVWQGYFRFTFGHIQIIHLSWMAHHVVTTGGPTPTRGAATCRYQELIQRQAGSLVTIDERVALPGTITAIQGGPVQVGPRMGTINLALTEDMTATIDYAC